jgi:hypothetical protein
MTSGLTVPQIYFFQIVCPRIEQAIKTAQFYLFSARCGDDKSF